MNTTSYAWLYMIASLLSFVFYLAALVWVSMQPRDRSVAKGYAITGLVIILISQIFGFAFRWGSAAFLSAEFFGVAHAIAGIAFQLIHLFAMGLIVAAVFVGRRPHGQSPYATLPERDPQEDGNPYASPSS